MVDGFEGYVPVLARIACISHVSSAQIDEGIFCGFGLSDALARDEVVFFPFRSMPTHWRRDQHKSAREVLLL